MNIYKWAELLDLEGVNAELVAKIIEDHNQTSTRITDRKGRYEQAKANTPILTRTFESEAAKKINSQLANDYFGEIVDTKVGYMFGAPVAYGYDKKAPNYQVATDTIERFKTQNNLDDLNAEWCKYAAIGGYDAGLLYIDKEGNERVIQLNGNESIIISKTNITEPEYGINYYETWDEKKRAEVYDGKLKYIFEGADYSSMVFVESRPHMFDYCPMFGIPNNAELMGDADKVFSLIDGYDRSLSDMNSEIEQFRNAYLKYIGYEPDEQVVADMIKTGALFIPSSADGENIEWLVKTLDPAYIDSHLDRLEANINRFAKHVNFTDEQFGGNLSGVAMRFKLFGLESKAKYFERKHNAATFYMFKVLGSAWSKKGIQFDYALLDAKYTRNLPVNVVDEATAATTAAGIASKRTALGMLSFITDVDEELERIKQEAEEFGEIDLDKVDLTKKDENEDI